jgi:hypothetical protein
MNPSVDLEDGGECWVRTDRLSSYLEIVFPYFFADMLSHRMLFSGKMTIVTLLEESVLFDDI